MTWFWRYVNFLATWREHRNAIKQLNMLTDRELNDIGMNHFLEISAVWGSALESYLSVPRDFG